MSPRVAVIGASGQLGRDFCSYLGDDCIALSHQDVELTNPDSLVRALQPVAADYVINTAAFNHVDEAELRPTEALATNALGTRELAIVCRDLNCVLVHYSTDYAFGMDQQRKEPYTESDVPGPISVYGVSKLAGEYFVQSICPRHFVIRTCGLYGLHGQGGKGRNFVRTMLRLGRERPEIRVVDDQRCTPTYTVDLVAATVNLLRSNAFGLYHWTNTDACSWYEFAREIFYQARIDVKCVPITSAEYAARARRPEYSVLSSAKYVALGFPPPRDWREALRAYLTELANEVSPG